MTPFLQEREQYRDPVTEALRALIAMNWNIEYDSMEGGGGREQLHRQDTV